MRFLLFLLIVAAVVTLPFVWLKRPWALRIWQRVRWFFVAYAIIILVTAIVSLIFRWDAIYG